MADLPTSLTLEVATPLGMQVSAETESVQVPSVSGELGLLPGHLPILAAVRPGILTYKKDGQRERAAVGGGFVEADANHVRVIAEFFQLPSQVDLEKAQKDLSVAEERLKAFKGTVEEVEHVEAQRDYDWAQARIQLARGAAD
jgi:F-type H+-transporting ATPase subunit epsilon